ncbi:hypothetical protein KAH43_00985, partial [Candidatus Bipolaricaulota bacterium]|nr:hypothetical protein [Candidatus Bipolaricaulota bacterium]
MHSRGVGGILAVLWLATSIAVFAQSGLLYLNEEPLSLIHPIIQQETSFLVPLEEFSRLLGLELSHAEGATILRGSGFRQTFDPDMVPAEDGVAYASLDWLLDLVDGTMHQVGGDTYLRTQRPQIMDIEASANQVTVRLTGFTSHELSVSQQGLSEILTITWPHSILGLDAQLIRIGESDIQAVRMVSSSSGVNLAITIETGTNLATEQLETDEFYSLTFFVSDTASVESIIDVGEGIAVHEWENIAESCAIDYVYIEAWRDQFRLLPAVPTEGYQSTASLQTILGSMAAAVAVSLDCPREPVATECLIMNGIPYIMPDTPSEVLAIDLFGRWATFSSLCSVNMKHAGTFIDVDGVNRPLAYGEIVLYASGYTGVIARGIPGSFSVIKIRDNRVVSVYDGPFVPAGASAILLVASGDARTRLMNIQLGDPIDVVCDFVHVDGTYPYAVTAGPQVMGDGVLSAPGNPFEVMDPIDSGTLLACDWHGGLYLLAFEG